MNPRPVDEWKEEVYLALKSKQTEFETFGYKEITTDDIWTCLKKHIWKKAEEKRLYEVVQSIFQLQIHTYMDYLALDSIHQQSDGTKDDLRESINAVMKQEE